VKIEVHLQGGLRKIIDITPGATVGATIGRNVFNADGTLYVPPSSGGSSQLSITSWELILNIPPNVTALANTVTTGLYAITAAGTSATRSIQAAPGETTVSNGDGVAGNPAVGLADVADTGAGALRGITRDAKGRINGTTDATITGTAGQIDVSNGDAVAGPPTISLADVADAGGGTFKLLTRDAKGRLSGTSDGDTDDVPEGAGNLYFTAARVRDTLLTGLSLASSAVISATDSVLSAFGKLQAQITALASSLSGYVPTSRTISTTAPLTGGGNLTANRTLAISAATTSAAGSMSAADKTKLNGIATGATAYTDATARAAVIASSIINGDTTHAPSGDAVFDALGGKEPTITAGTTGQFWRGDKTFSNTATNQQVVSADLTTAQWSAVNPTNSNGKIAAYRMATGSGWASKVISIQDQWVAAFALDNNSIIFGHDGTRLRANFDHRVQKDIPAYEMVSPGAVNGWRFLGNVSDAVDFGFNIEQLVSGTFTPRYAFNETQFLPAADNAASCGTPGSRWSVIYAATSIINTSDAREKTKVEPLSNDELAAAKELAREIGTYRWLSAIESKGDDARLHVGITVQRVIEIMESCGLSPFKYGFICYDKWDEAPELWEDVPEGIGEDGSVVVTSNRVKLRNASVSGDRYSFRMDELILFIARGQEERLARLEALLNP